MSVRMRYLGIVLIVYMVLPLAGHALQVLEGADHAELEAEISATAVNRVALERDRIVRVVQAPGGLVVEHDPVRGDIYLSTDRLDFAADVWSEAPRLTLYLGTERGLTYRLSLRAVERDSAQILIRNVAAASGAVDGADGSRVDAYAGEMVELIRAVARNEPPPGYPIVPGPAHGRSADSRPVDGERGSTVAVVETWRGRRYAVRVLRVAAGAGLDAEALASRSEGNALAAWIAEEPTEFGGARRGAVVEPSDLSGTGR